MSQIGAIWTHFLTIFRIHKPAGPEGPPGVKHFDLFAHLPYDPINLIMNPPTLAVGVWEQTNPVSLQSFRRLPPAFRRGEKLSSGILRASFGPPFDILGPWGREKGRFYRYQPRQPSELQTSSTKPTPSAFRASDVCRLPLDGVKSPLRASFGPPSGRLSTSWGPGAVKMRHLAWEGWKKARFYWF